MLRQKKFSAKTENVHVDLYLDLQLMQKHDIYLQCNEERELYMILMKACLEGHWVVEMERERPSG